MKKIIAMLLVAVMAMGLVACSTATEEDNKDSLPVETTTTPVETEPAVVESPVDVLSAVWAQYGEEEKFYVAGGDYQNPVDNAPGAVTAQDHMTATLLVPEAEIANVAEAAGFMHAMIANNFTCGAYKLVDGADSAAFVTAMQNAVQGNQWICGFPETLVIANVNGVIVVAFGNGEIITTFQNHLTAVYGGAEILVNEAIGG